MERGSCLCGQVVYQVTDLTGPLVYCHCSFCQKATSSAFSINVTIPQEQVTFVRGQDKLVTYESSPGKIRYYYSNCHSQMYHVKDSQPEQITLKVGLLDQIKHLENLPHKHINQDSTLTWLSDT